MAKRKPSTIVEDPIEEEITRLRQSEYVKLAQRELAIRYRRRKIMYELRQYEKRGRALAEQGVTLDNIEEKLFTPVEM